MEVQAQARPFISDSGVSKIRLRLGKVDSLKVTNSFFSPKIIIDMIQIPVHLKALTK
jgi:hypothetical protein